MGKFKILVSNNMRKNKGQYISLFLIMLLAAVIFHLGIITYLNFGSSYDEKYEEYKSADVLNIVPKGSYDDDDYNKIKEIGGIKALEKRDCVLLMSSIDFGDSKFSILHAFFDMDKFGELDNVGIAEESSESYEKPIYISYWLKSAGGYKVGDPYVVHVADNDYKFTVKGFVEDINYGRGICGCIGVYLPADEYKSFASNFDDSYKGVNLSCKVDKKNESKNVFSKVSDILSANVKGEYCSGYYSVGKEARLMTAGVIAMIFMAFSIIIMLVSMLISNFKISNSIDEEMQNMGALKAVGYTGKQIIKAMVIPYVLISTSAVLLGIGLSYLLLPYLESALNIQTGLIWRQGFDFKSMFITLIIISGLTILIAYLSTGKIKKLKPIEALRGGLSTHNFKRNYFQLEKTLGSVNFIISLKNLASNMKQNILLVLVVISITVAAVFSSVMFYNINVEPKVFLHSITEETPSVRFIVNNEHKVEAIKDEIRDRNNVKDTLYYDMDNVMMKGEKLPVFITKDYLKLDNDICYEGRNPLHDNEIAIGSALAKEKKLSVGDTVELSYRGNYKEYLICGLVQAVNYNGDVCEITTSGFEKIDDNFRAKNLYVYLEDEDETESFIDEVMSDYSEDIGSYINDVDSVKSATNIFTSITSSICFVIFTVTVLIIILILYLIIKTMIIHKKQDLGILKSLGYTTKQLIIETALSFIPVIIVGVIIGSVISYKNVNYLLLLLFKQIGVMKINFMVPLAMLLIIGFIICVFSFLISIIISRRIKRISAYSLIKE